MKSLPCGFSKEAFKEGGAYKRSVFLLKYSIIFHTLTKRSIDSRYFYTGKWLRKKHCPNPYIVSNERLAGKVSGLGVGEEVIGVGWGGTEVQGGIIGEWAGVGG